MKNFVYALAALSLTGGRRLIRIRDADDGVTGPRAALIGRTDRRGEQIELTYAGSRAMMIYRLPLNEVVFDFYDRLKSVTKGYASFDYQISEYREDFLVKMSILVNDEPVDALSIMVHRDRAESRGRAMVEKLKELIPRQQFEVSIQAAIGTTRVLRPFP